MLSRQSELDFFLLNDNLIKTITQFKKSLHKFNSFRREIISKLPGGMALYVSC